MPSVQFFSGQYEKKIPKALAWVEQVTIQKIQVKSNFDLEKKCLVASMDT